MNFKTLFRDFLFRVKDGEKNVFAIEVSTESVSLLKNDVVLTRINWADVSSIAAFRQDRITYDPIVICLVHSPDEKYGTSFSEFVKGFDGLVLEINTRYSLDGDWFNRVNVGVFDENLELLWKRA